VYIFSKFISNGENSNGVRSILQKDHSFTDDIWNVSNALEKVKKTLRVGKAIVYDLSIVNNSSVSF
jgi:hypothetical protein